MTPLRPDEHTEDCPTVAGDRAEPFDPGRREGSEREATSRRAWIALFFRDMQRAPDTAPSPVLDEGLLALALHEAGVSCGDGDHSHILDAREVLSALAAPSSVNDGTEDSDA